jgi:hypothetical protein
MGFSDQGDMDAQSTGNTCRAIGHVMSSTVLVAPAFTNLSSDDQHVARAKSGRFWSRD